VGLWKALLGDFIAPKVGIPQQLVASGSLFLGRGWLPRQACHVSFLGQHFPKEKLTIIACVRYQIKGPTTSIDFY